MSQNSFLACWAIALTAFPSQSVMSTSIAAKGIARKYAFTKKTLLMRQGIVWVLKFPFMVMFDVFRTRHYHKILDPIVQLVLINMMNYFMWIKSPTEVVLHDKAMFRQWTRAFYSHPSIAGSNCTVSIWSLLNAVGITPISPSRIVLGTESSCYKSPSTIGNRAAFHLNWCTA